MAKKKIIDEPTYIENISVEPMDTVMDSRAALYAKDVIQDRAIPDLRDGLKPVQRRIIYSMYRNNNTVKNPTRKCAGIVGDVMGKFHPHGDSSIYEALVRMSQDWKMSMPLIQFQGNNGSIDNDPAAHYRYTEAKLNEFSNYLIEEIDQDTIDMSLNFDDTLFEPTVLPARFPNLFVNGASGIAFAIATEIPPHNLTEISEAAIYRLNHPNCSLDELLEIVKGPDFPTGGILNKSQGIRDIYQTGKGKIDLYANVNIDTSDKNVNRLIIDSIPYGVVKIDLVYSIDKIRKSKEVDGILDVIDESAGDGVRIVIEIKKDVDPENILKYLLVKTELKISYTANIMAISKNAPKLLPLIDYLDDFNAFQTELILRRSNFELAKAKARLHIVEGLIIAINNIEEVVRIIRKSNDKQDSKNNLIARFGFSPEQAEAIVTMQLYKLSNSDVTVYINEKAELIAKIADLEEIISTPLRVKHIIVDDLRAICKKFGVERRTKIEEYGEEKISVDKRALITKEDVYVTLTKDGYINRSSIKSHDSSNNDLPKIKEYDNFVMSQMVNTLDYILAFTNLGNYLFIPVSDIEDGKYKDQGKHINYIANLPFNESIIKTIVVKDFDAKATICTVSTSGQIKKTALNEFFATRYSKPISCMKLSKNDDYLADVCVLNGNSNILVITEKGICTYFNENEFSATGLKTSGVKAISTLKNSSVKSLFAINSDEKKKLLFVTDNKMYRIFDTSNLFLTNRLGRTQFVFKSFKSDLHLLKCSEEIFTKDFPLSLHFVMSDKSICDFAIDECHLTPIDKYCKDNMNLGSKAQIEFMYNFTSEVIDSNFVSEKPKHKPTTIFSEEVEEEQKPQIIEAKVNLEVKETEEENNDSYEQISIFDDMGD